MLNKKIKSTVYCLLITVAILIMLTVAVSAAMTNSGTSDDPYEIRTAEDLFWFAEQVNTVEGRNNINGKLMNDIDLNPGYTFTFETDTGLVKIEKAGEGIKGYYGTGIQGAIGGNATFDASASLGGYFYESDDSDYLSMHSLSLTQWTPIGTDNKQYTGTFDGNGKTVRGMFFSNNSDYIGLFGYIGSDGTVKKVTVADSYIFAKHYVGGICGNNVNGTIINCSNSATITAFNSVGGICGNLSGGDITNCYNIGNIKGKQSIGSVLGSNSEGTVTNCFYLTGSATDIRNTLQFGIGIASAGNNAADTDESTADKTTLKFADGSVTVALNIGTNPIVWYQKDGIPTLIPYAPAKFNDNNTTSNTYDDYYEIETAENLLWFASEVNGGNTVINGKLMNDINLNPGYTFTLIPDTGLVEVKKNEDINGYFGTGIKGKSGGNTFFDGDTVSTAGTFYTLNPENEFISGTAPLDLREWTQIGADIVTGYKYSGKFDGNGKTVSGIFFNNASADNAGMFGCTDFGDSAGEIKNLTVANTYIYGGRTVGSICGKNLGIISGCQSFGIIIGSGDVGGICGDNGGELSDSQNACTVRANVASSEGYAYAGGVCGYNYYYGTLIRCSNIGAVSSIGKVVGGVCGSTGRPVTNCYNTGTVSGSDSVGGICGGIGSSGTLNNCYNTGTVSGTGKNVGGICGLYEGTITNCYYLNGCAKDGNNVEQFGIGNGTQGETTPDTAITTGKTAGEFADGSVAYILNGNRSAGTEENPLVWYQKLAGEAKDNSPTLTYAESKTVYYGYKNCGSTEKTYSNEPMHDSIPPHPDTFDTNGFCSVCGGNYYQPITPVDSVYQITNAGQFFWFAAKVNSGDNAINGKLMTDINLNPGYTFTFDPDTGLVTVTKEGGVTVYLGTGTKGDTSGENTFFDGDTVSSAGSFYSSDSSDATCVPPSDLRKWVPISDYGGKFDGNYKVVNGLYFNDDVAKEIGMFKTIVNSGKVENITIANSCIRGYVNIGGVCGANNGTLTNCHSSAIVIGTNYIGGVCGNNIGTVNNCSNSGNVISYNASAGGVCGQNSGGEISACSNIGTVNGNVYVGGVCGLNHGNNAKMTDCYNYSGTVKGSDRVGGVCGHNINGTLINCQNSGIVISTNQNAGGVCGSNKGDSAKMTDCYNSGTVNGSSYAGGVCGFNEGMLLTCHNTGNVTANGDYAGGVCGSNNIESAKMTGCYNSGAVNGNYYVGGVCGFNHGTLTGCYNTNTVNGNSYVGGVCGSNAGVSAKIADCYNTGNVTATGDVVEMSYYVGGVCGDNYGTLTGCYNTGNVTATGDVDARSSNVGGVCGGNYGILASCYNTGTVSNMLNSTYTEGVGGVCGYITSENENIATITDCYNIGTVRGIANVGGVYGYISGYNTGANLINISDCYNIGAVRGTSNYVGGVCGQNNNLATITNCYYLIGCATDGGGRVQFGMGSATQGSAILDTESTTGKTDGEFADGSVTYILNGNRSAGTEANPLVWYQKLAGEAIEASPTLTYSEGKTVYYGYENCISAKKAYSNEPLYIERPHFFSAESNGFCTVCENAYQSATLNKNGTEEDATDDYYEISNAGQLFWFASYVNSGNTVINGKLTTDIYLNPGYTFSADGSYTGGVAPREWTPIGNETDIYIGTFDGNGKTVNGIYYNNNMGNYVGLFGYVGGTVKKVGVLNSYLYGNQSVGGVCGSCDDYTSLTNCSNAGAVSGGDTVGGVCGYGDDYASLTNCSNTGAVSGGNNVGGVCGYSKGNITSSYNVGKVTEIGKPNSAGIVGRKASGTVNNCYYLNTSATCGINANSGGNWENLSPEGEAVKRTSAQFADGSVAWLLNTAGKNDGEAGYAHSGVWSQGASYPVFADETNKAIYKLSITGAKSATYYTDAAGKCAVLETVHINGVSTETVHGADTAYTADTAITSVQPSLGSSITMIYEARILTSLIGSSTPQMLFTYHEKAHTVDGTAGTPVGDYTPYTFDFINVAPQCMGDSIDASLTVDGKTVTKTGYSLKVYCNTMLAKTDAEISGILPATATTDEYRQLICDILVYGGAAQVYRGYNLGEGNANLVSNGITGSTFNTLEQTETARALSGTKNDNAYFTATGVRFDNINKVYWRVKTSDASKLTVKIYEVGEGGTETLKETRTGASGLTATGTEGEYVAYSGDIEATGFATVYKAVIEYNGEAAQAASYSVKSYVVAKQNEGTSIAALVRALYNYGVSAMAYER